ncbi:hypothetical protein DFH09DRAFT_1089384 [Mycena vulgaris]|nr:hypothetical protein DFH09DRAFT_1089384 [Mycena vulgaris]
MAVPRQARHFYPAPRTSLKLAGQLSDSLYGINLQFPQVLRRFWHTTMPPCTAGPVTADLETSSVGIVTVRPGRQTAPKPAVQWTVRRRYSRAASLAMLDGTGRWTDGQSAAGVAPYARCSAARKCCSHVRLDPGVKGVKRNHLTCDQVVGRGGRKLTVRFASERVFLRSDVHSPTLRRFLDPSLDDCVSSPSTAESSSTSEAPRFFGLGVARVGGGGIDGLALGFQ